MVGVQTGLNSTEAAIDEPPLRVMSWVLLLTSVLVAGCQNSALLAIKFINVLDIEKNLEIAIASNIATIEA